MNSNLSDKVVLVTGGSRGIGRSTAVLFAEQGARVIIHYHKNKVAAEEVSNNLKGNNHCIIQADMGDSESIGNLFETAVKKYERIDILVNNAGIYGEVKVLELNYSEWQKKWAETIRTNLIGPANLSYLVINHMVANGGGRIINVTSRGAFRGEPNAPDYGASKAGLNSFGQSMAVALANHKVMVFTVAPGFVETDMAEPFLAGPEGESIKKQSPLKRAATPDEIAETIVFLASGNNEYLTGCIIDINGASYLRS